MKALGKKFRFLSSGDNFRIRDEIRENFLMFNCLVNKLILFEKSVIGFNNFT